MKRILIAAAAALMMLASCGHEPSGARVIDVSAPSDAVLEDIASDIRIIPLDESAGLIPEIYSAKLFGDRLLLHEYAKSVTVFDGGKFVGKLDARGRSEQEYLNLYSFTYLPQTEEILVYDLILRAIKAYHVPDMKWTRTIPMQDCKDYLNGFEALDEHHSFYAGSRNPTVWDHRRNAPSLTVPVPKAGGSFGGVGLTGSHFEQDRGALRTFIPGSTIKIIDVEADRYTVLDSLVFRPELLPPDFWEGDYSEEKAAVYQEAMTHDHFASGCYAPVLRGRNLAFWYFGGRRADETGATAQDVPPLHLYLDLKGRRQAVSSLHVGGASNPLQPDVCEGNRWGSVLELPLPSVGHEPGRVKKQLDELAAKGYEHALLLYSVL